MIALKELLLFVFIICLPLGSVAKNNFSNSLGYNVSTDLLDPAEEKLYSHNLLLDTSFSHKISKKKRLSFSAGVGVKYSSVENKVVREGDKRDFFELRDTSLSVDYSQRLSRANKMSSHFSTSFPASNESRYEGYKAIIDLGGSLRSRLYFPWLHIRNSLSGAYILNTYDFSPVSNEINPKYHLGYKASLSFSFFKSISYSISAKIRRTEYMTGENQDLFSFAHGQSLSYSYKKLSVSLSFSNGSFSSRDYEFWYINKTQKNIMLGLRYSI